MCVNSSKNYSLSSLRFLATARRLPNIANPNPAKPVFVSDSPVFAKRFVDLLADLSTVVLPSFSFSGTSTLVPGFPFSLSYSGV